MSKLKQMAGLYLYAAMLAGNSNNNHFGLEESFQESDEDRENRLKNFEIRNNERKGLSVFNYGENSIWALNKKSADKKAKKKGWI